MVPKQNERIFLANTENMQITRLPENCCNEKTQALLNETKMKNEILFSNH